MEYPSLDTPTAGATRFNTDSSQLEIYDGNQWTGVLATSPELQTGGTRAVCMSGGTEPAFTDNIDYVNLASTGNAITFGDAIQAGGIRGGCSSRTRGLFNGGQQPAVSITDVQKVEISSTGNATDFGGDFSSAEFAIGEGLASATRAVWKRSSTSNGQMDYFTIAHGGNANDFGDSLFQKSQGGGLASPTRGCFMAGSPDTNAIEYMTIATLGNNADFGDLTLARHAPATASNAVRGLCMGGTGLTNVIDYFTIPTLGNAKDFGDLTSARRQAGAAASPTRAAAFGADYSPSSVNTIDYVQISSTGNATDFGDRTEAKGCAAVSNGHGGL